jgi:hypothetical protein
MTAIVAVLACAAGFAPVLGAKAAKFVPSPATESAQPVAATSGPSSDAALSLLPAGDDGGACWVEDAKDASAQTNDSRPKHGYCQCGCGIRCTTSADCGGSPCRAFITCC